MTLLYRFPQLKGATVEVWAELPGARASVQCASGKLFLGPPFYFKIYQI